MRKTTKKWLITAVSLILAGTIIFSGVMTMLNWDFTKLSTTKSETNEHKITIPYKNISVTTKASDIEFLPTENQETKVVCFEEEKAKHSVKVIDGQLIIELIDTRKWYEHISINFRKHKVIVYIPAGEYGNLTINATTGDIKIPEHLKLENINISQTTGDITNLASASKDIKIKNTTGDVRCENISCDTFKISVTTGDITLKNVIMEKKLSAKATTGDIKFEDTDAGEIFIKATTGDITGTLLSEKVFIASATTCKVNIPKTAIGGKCEIKTTTGDINIQIQR